MGSVKIRVNIDRYLKKSRQLKRANYELLGNVGKRLIKVAQNNAPYKTGALRGAIQIRKRTTKRLTVGTRLVRYARIHEFGGVICPKRHEYLHFKVNGQWVRARSVKIREKRYMRNARDQVQREVKAIARKTYAKYGW